MIIKKFTLLVATLALLWSCGGSTTSFETDSMEMKVDKSGLVTSLIKKENGENYATSPSALLSLRVDTTYFNPSSMEVNSDEGKILLSYDGCDAKVTLNYVVNEKYLTFEVADLESSQKIDIALWGPYNTKIEKIIGECVGVVRDSSFAIGIQALNSKTLGGYPSSESDIDPQYNIFAQTSLVDVADDTKVLYRGQTAIRNDEGSQIQAYCRDRSEDRIIENWAHTDYVAPAYNDGGIKGTKIALFGSSEAETLDYLEAIEVGENLPHPTLDGEWVKRTPNAACAYIIYPFNENNIDEALEFVNKTGLKYLYHGGPFTTWGNFELNPKEYPTGLAGMKKCVEIAAEKGVKLGFHTLSNFITTNDAYVTPVPDRRLAAVGSSVISSDITATQNEVPIDDPKFFNQMKNNSLHGVRIGDELVRYERVSDEAPWKLLNCERGAWGTKAASHTKSDEIVKLMDHGYKVFLSDTELTKEIARNIANIMNETGARQISFDGLEGNHSTGMGQYGLNIMMEEWYNTLKPEYHDNINDASMTTHFNWHIFTRMNWGEPWYAGFRESQMGYRLMNQDFYRRNLIPCMLGWFKLDATTSIEDIDWLLARTAAFDAGYTLVTDKKQIEANGVSDQIINSIKEWEKARLSGAFSTEVKREMEHTYNEYKLKTISDNSWELFHCKPERFKHLNVERQPGEPVVSKWTFENMYERQPIQFMIKATAPISNITIEINNSKTITIPVSLKVGETIKYEGGDKISICNENWVVTRTIPAKSSDYEVSKGENNFIFSCKFSSSNVEDSASMEAKTFGEAIKISSK